MGRTAKRMSCMPRAIAPLVTMTISWPSARRRATSSQTRPTTSTRSAPSSCATIEDPSLTTSLATIAVTCDPPDDPVLAVVGKRTQALFVPS